MIFLTFYRKFMTPYQLVQSLIERFEQDYGCEHQPTRLQERIRTILCLWLSHHWGDIYYGQSHQTLNLFLQRLGHNQRLSTMYQLLGPLITRPGPASDPDSVWGLTDEETDHHLNYNCNNFYGLWANSPSITTMLCMSPSSQSIISEDHRAQQRRSSSFDWYKDELSETKLSAFPQVSSSTIPSSTNCVNTPLPTISTDSYSSNTSRKKKENTRSSSFFNNKIGPKRNAYQQFMGNPASFGGGSVLLETTGRRPFSLIALQSSLRHMSHVRYAMLMDLSVDLLAEQLTWVELTLYRNIKPRDYIRHLWGEKGASEAMMAFISHGHFIKGWVVSMILSQNHSCQQLSLLEKFIDLAYRLYHDHRNYNTLASVLDGLNHLMQDLNPIKFGLNGIKHQQLQELETLMKPDRNYAVYRQDLEDSNDGSSIPYLWVHRQDIVTLAETKRDVTLCGGIHWEKFRYMGEIILRLTQAISITTTIQPNPCVLAFISDTTLLTETERSRRLDEFKLQ
ncbi:ras guanine nucleotide exchange factor domain-containing protein [Chlamydoabsidia padenii]|nr:ras guanine nucleotide exchange factor domain-containing protein [Chlamydoabsidia padenii]